MSNGDPVLRRVASGTAITLSRTPAAVADCRSPVVMSLRSRACHRNGRSLGTACTTVSSALRARLAREPVGKPPAPALRNRRRRGCAKPDSRATPWYGAARPWPPMRQQQLHQGWQTSKRRAIAHGVIRRAPGPDLDEPPRASRAAGRLLETTPRGPHRPRALLPIVLVERQTVRRLDLPSRSPAMSTIAGYTG
jgi:hypothetical protein